MRKKCLITLLAAVSLCLSGLVFPTSAEEMVTVFEENFDEYADDVNATATSIGEFFKTEANSIGDSYIRVKEDDKGNLFLKSHVFTQVYSKEGIKGAYIFSLSSAEMQGGHQTGVFIRAPQNKSAYYEGDNGDPAYGNSTGLSGIWVYASYDKIDVNIKSFTSQTSGHVQNNYHSFDMPEGSHCGNGSSLNLRFEDIGTSVSIYADNTLICTLNFGEQGQGYAQLEITENCFKTVTMLDANGQELMTVQDTLVMADSSIIGWATRVAEMSVDNVKVEVTQSEAPTETPTEAPTEPPTEAQTEAPTETPTEASDSSAATVPDTADEQESGPTESAGVVETIDDSLAIYILIAVMLVAVGITAGVIVVKKRK